MERQKVEIGAKFGYLTVIKKVEPYISPNGFKATQYLCKCQCGNEKILTSGRLTSGGAISCGCEKIKKDLGSKYGKLTIIGQADPYISPKGTKQTKYLCKCECGKTVSVLSSRLKSGKVLSCGCDKIDTMIGKRFGKLTVISIGNPYSYGKNKVKRYMCRCDCGREKEITKNSLINGGLTDCGCEHKTGRVTTYKIGDRYGMLTIIGSAEATDYRATRVVCKCDCGNTTTVYLQHLKSGATKSCGCLLAQATAKRSTTHGKSTERLYGVWQGMKDRCYEKTSQSYKNYGGRGITVCDEWRNDFQAFYDWSMANGYEEEVLPNGKNKWTIDRINFNGNYEPSNCRWADMKTQANNKRPPKGRFEINGERKTLLEWCKIYNISRAAVQYRLYKKKWDILKALITPLKKRTA